MDKSVVPARVDVGADYEEGRIDQHFSGLNRSL